MRARAPGKLVISGAYAVLEGAPALVTSVDRFAVADTSRPAGHITAEVASALRRRSLPPPWFDAAALRTGPDAARKLGLGSSAAVLVASLAAIELDLHPHLDSAALATAVFAPAWRAHREAQGGGSGIDVAASAFGGTLRCVLTAPGTAAAALCCWPHRLPTGLVIRVLVSPVSASTSAMLAAVLAARQRAPGRYHEIIGELTAAAEGACAATRVADLVESLGRQGRGLERLGEFAGTEVVPRAMGELDRLARRRRAVLLPSGAGGGDVAIWAGPTPPDDEFEVAARRRGFTQLEVALDAGGVHAC